MEQSQEIADLIKALVKVQGKIKPAEKNANNPFFKSGYADLASITESCRSELASNGLAVIQTTDTQDGAVVIVTTLAHETGQWIRGRLAMRPVKDDCQSYGSAISYGRRYALAGIVGVVVAGEDDDGNAATHTQKPASKPKNDAPETASKINPKECCPCGKNKGQLWTEMSVEDLKSAHEYFKKQMEDPKNARYREHNGKAVAGITHALLEKSEDVPY